MASDFGSLNTLSELLTWPFSPAGATSAWAPREGAGRVPSTEGAVGPRGRAPPSSLCAEVTLSGRCPGWGPLTREGASYFPGDSGRWSPSCLFLTSPHVSSSRCHRSKVSTCEPTSSRGSARCSGVGGQVCFICAPSGPAHTRLAEV